MPGRSSNSANPTDNYKFTGHERDDEAGLTIDYMMARNYDPMIGRFMQIDPRYDLYRGWTPYHYTLNNPLIYTDPTGECILQLPCPKALAAGITKTRSQINEVVGGAVDDYVDYANSFDLSQGSEWGRLVADQVPLISYSGQDGLTFDNPIQGASDAVAEVQTAGVNFIEGDADTKAKVIIGAVVALAQYGLSKGKKVNKVGPNQDASGPHTSFKVDADGNISGYTTFDGSGNATKRFRNSGKPHGGVEAPLVYEQKPGKGSNAPLSRARSAEPDEIPKRNN